MNNYCNKTKLSAKEEEIFQAWRKKLPQNLQKDDQYYDLRGAWKAGLKPKKGKDKKYHLQSRDPKTGLILKHERHPTFALTIKAEQRLGYSIYFDKKKKRLYSRKSNHKLNKEKKNL